MPDLFESTVQHRVPFYETDAMGIVHHSNYLRYFELARITVQAVPFLRCLCQMTMNSQPLAVLLQPTSQRRPLPDQRLMRYLHRVLTYGDQPHISQRL